MDGGNEPDLVYKISVNSGNGFSKENAEGSNNTQKSIFTVSDDEIKKLLEDNKKLKASLEKQSYLLDKAESYKDS